MTNHHGGCLCGRVRYVLHGEPDAVCVCHCTHCQKQTSSAFSIVALAPKTSVEIKGELATYADTGDSGQAVLRRFCPTCGSPVVGECASMPDVQIIKAGTFNDTDWLQPTFNIYCDSAQSWVKIPEGQQNFGRMPT